MKNSEIKNIAIKEILRSIESAYVELEITQILQFMAARRL